MRFELFDPDAEFAVSSRYLPHWFQPGATYFVTFRTADSLPRSVVELWLEERNQWLLAHQIEAGNPHWRASLQRLPTEEQREFHRTFTDGFHRFLDAGYGECLLRQPEAAEVVAASLRHFDGEQYHMSDFVVMPNHVHALFGLIGETELEAVCYSWKHFTANKINRLVGRKGHFWQGESFDHLVRSPEQLTHLRRYIEANPVKAGLKPGEFILYQSSKQPAPE